MNQVNLGIATAILLMITLQLYRRTKLYIKAKNTVVEKTSLGISLVMVAVVTLFGSSEPMHYVIGALLALLIIASMAKTGISPGGLHAMNRIFIALPWSRLRFAKIVKRKNGEEFQLHSVGRVWTNVMTFDMKDFDRTLDLLKKRLSSDQYEVTMEKLEEGLREQTKSRK